MIQPWLRYVSRRAAPKKIDLLIRGCNLHCPMCSMNANSRDLPQILRDYPGASTEPELGIEEYKRIFRGLGHWKPIVSIGGGEPMTFDQMIELITFLRRELGFPVILTTNGTLFGEKEIKAFVESGANITVSIDGMKETHDRIRGHGAFQKATGLLRELVKRRPLIKQQGKLFSLFALHEANYGDTLAVVRLLLEDIGIDSLTISFLVFSTAKILDKHQEWVKTRRLPPEYEISIPRGGVFNRDSLRRIDFNAIWEMKQTIEAKYPKVRFEPDFKGLEDLKRYFLMDEVMPRYFGQFCSPANQEMVLLSNGDVLFFPGCFEIKLGNVRETALQDIWNGKKLEGIRKTLSSDLSPICSHCCGNRIEKHL